MYFQSPTRSTTNSSKLTQALNSATPVTSLTSSGSCPKDKRIMTHLANQPPVAQSGYRYFGTGYSLGRTLSQEGYCSRGSQAPHRHSSRVIGRSYRGGEEPVIAGRDPASN